MNWITVEQLCEKLCLEERYVVIYDSIFDNDVFYGYGKEAMSSKFRHRIALSIGTGGAQELVITI